MFEVIDTLEKLDKEAKAWRSVERSPDMLIFQTFDWCRSAWVHILSKDKANKLWTLKWTQDGRDDVVFFPFYIDGKGTLRYILDTDSDALNSVYSGRTANRYWCYREVADAIIAAQGIKNVSLQKMRCGSEALDYLGVLLSGAIVYKDNAFAFMDVEPGGDIVFSRHHMRSSDRKHWRHLLKKSDKFDFDVLRQGKGDDFPEAEVGRLVSEMSAAGMRKPGFFAADMMEFVKHLYSLGLCEIPVLKENGKVATIEFRLLKNGYVLDWIFLSSIPSTGTEINVKYCTEKAKEFCGTMDFGVGAYEYKILTSRPKLGVTFSIKYAKNSSCFVANLLSMCMRVGKDWIKGKRH